MEIELLPRNSWALSLLSLPQQGIGLAKNGPSLKDWDFVNSSLNCNALFTQTPLGE